jgi:membrane protein implicated in regulation of membrane protease activity
VAIPVAAIVAAAGGAGLVAVARKTGSARTRRIRTGTEAMVGRVGVLQSWAGPEGRVFVDGSLWKARRSWPEESVEGLHPGDRVIVERVSGLTLAVRRAEEWEVLS